jgi:hypothetical protein
MGVTSFTYSIPYLIFMVYLVVLMFLEFRLLKFGQEIKYIRWATIFGFVFFFGLRGFVFSDWGTYYNMFEKMPSLWEGAQNANLNEEINEMFSTDVNIGKTGVEMGFVILTLLLKSIIPNYFAWVCFNAFLDILLLDIFIRRYSPYYVLSIILFVTFGGLIIEFNLMRNVKAILLFLVSLKYLQERKIIPYMLLNLAGFMFHSSAIVFFPLYFFLHKECPKWLMWFIFIVGNIITLMHIGYLRPLMLYAADFVGGRIGVQIKLYFAIDFFSQSYGISIGYIERIFTFVLLIIYQKKLIELNIRNNIFINGYIMYFVIFFFFSEIMVAVERLSLLFAFSYWILYPVLLSTVKEIPNKLVLFLTLILFCGMKVTLATNNIFAKYDNVLFGIESFESRSQRMYNDLDTLLDSKKK